MKVRAVDMGGHEIARKMWLQYSHEADGIVYIVDAVDRERFPERGPSRLCFGSCPSTAAAAIAAAAIAFPATAVATTTSAFPAAAFSAAAGATSQRACGAVRFGWV